ncbi:DUF3108 domain-containing protein [Roseococcus sp. DSY-14]|uniref:DUF3108 domain-containing protein n=1 Tax=Roseococcus sp. DSY-14 TaxID=3369650 RepID=UPI00387B9465
MKATRILLAAALAGATPAMAAPWRAEYAVTVSGITVLEAQVLFDIDGAGYRVETRTRSRGVATLVSRGHQRTLAEGSWRGGTALPRRYETEGQWRGAVRNAVLDYANGAPRIRRLEPPEDMPRTPVPEDALPGTLDSLSILAMLARQVGATARCDGRARMFDGRRLTDFSARTLEQTPQGLHCEVEARAIAGIPTDRDPAQARAPQVLQAWFVQPVPGGPAVPRAVEFPSRWWGRIEANLLRLEPATPR